MLFLFALFSGMSRPKKLRGQGCKISSVVFFQRKSQKVKAESLALKTGAQERDAGAGKSKEKPEGRGPFACMIGARARAGGESSVKTVACMANICSIFGCKILKKTL